MLKSLIPKGPRETLWRLRSMPWRDAVGILRLVRSRDLRTALRAYYGADQFPERFTISARGYRRPIVMRGRTTDFFVFRQVLVEKQYGSLPIADPRVIIDAGANIGLTSMFFLERYPHARITAIEPDIENLSVARENLAAYGDRCTLVHGALWSHRTQLDLCRTGAHWETRVMPAAAAPVDDRVEAYSLDDLMRMFSLPSIDVLKIDIEGAETDVLRAEATPAALANVRSIAIELHDAAGRQAFHDLAARLGFDQWTRGELTIARRR